MSQRNQNHNNLDHKDTKIFVGGLAWKTTTDDLRSFFQRFGDVLDANIVLETYPTRRSKGYGFVTFRDAESAARALENPNPIIDGRQANINLAYLRAKNNNTNQSNKNGLLHQPGPSHQYQNGPVNQVSPHQYQLAPQYTNPHFPPFYWDPNYGQFRYMYNTPYHPYHMTYHHHYISTYGTQQNLHQTDIRIPVRISTPQTSSVRIKDISETNQEVVTADVADIDTESDSDVSDQQQKAKDQEGDNIGQDNDDVKQDAKDQEGEISEHEDGIKQDAKDQEVEILTEQYNDIKKDAKDQEAEIVTGQDYGIKQNVEDLEVGILIGQDYVIDFGDTYQNERVFEELKLKTPNGFDHEGNCEYTSEENGIDQEAEGQGQECMS